jgi:ribosomal protein L22
MDALLNALMAIGLLLILILIIYLIDRVNAIEKETRKVMTSINEKSALAATPFMGLSSKKLWDVMTGRAAEGLDANAITELRSQYQVVLSKHMEALYQEGFKDGQRGMSGETKNTKQISTSKGLVESWIPSAQANALYQCGLNASQTPEAEWGPIRASMDEAGQFLMGKTQLDASSPLSDWLMPVLNPAASPGAAQGPQAVLAPAVEPAGTPGSVAS